MYFSHHVSRAAQRTGDARGYPAAGRKFVEFFVKNSQKLIFLALLDALFDVMPGGNQPGSPTLCAALSNKIKRSLLNNLKVI